MTKYDERDLLMQDFMTVETNVFPKNGGHHTPAHTFSDFKFSTFAPLAFRYFLNLFGVKRDDFMVSVLKTIVNVIEYKCSKDRYNVKSKQTYIIIIFSDVHL